MRGLLRERLVHRCCGEYIDDPRSRKTRVLLANVPRAYREVIASAIRALRPNLEVESTEPDELDGCI